MCDVSFSQLKSRENVLTSCRRKWCKSSFFVCIRHLSVCAMPTCFLLVEVYSRRRDAFSPYIWWRRCASAARAEKTELQTKNRNVVNYREKLIFHSGMHNWLRLDWIGSEASIWHRMVSHSVMREWMILPVRPILIQWNSFILNESNGMRVEVSLTIS